MKTSKGCNMKGLLSFQILWLLSKKEMYGDEIAEEIGKRRGEKPKPSTIYPALKELSDNGLIIGKKTNKIIIYKLTSIGIKEVHKTTEYFCRSFGEILEENKNR
ncbi:MAG: PadR family transcriptional regulator [Candidatus Micrarchaeia archaeon]